MVVAGLSLVFHIGCVRRYQHLFKKVGNQPAENLPCPIKTRKFQCTSPPFSHIIFPSFWRLLGCQCTRLWVNRFVRAPCCPKTILCAANDLWTQKNLTLSLVQKSEGAHMKHNSTLHWCASISNGYFDIKRCVSFKKSKDQGYEKNTISTNRGIYRYY